jgi:hypothetical protein
MNAERAAGLVRRWVGIYTGGLPAEIRQERRDEIDDDLWSQMIDAERSARTDQSLTGEIVIRLVFGIPADLSWRAEQRRVTGKQVAPERSPSMGGRGPALLAILGGIGWVTWPIPQALVGREWPSDNSAMLWLLFVSVVLGAWVLASAMLGLVVTFQDRLRGIAAFLGSVGAAVGAISVLGAFAGIVAMPIGSAALMWDLRRAGVLGTWLARAHVAAAMLFLVPLVALFANGALLDHPETAVPLLALDMPYGFSWIAIGWSLRHGAPSPERAAESASPLDT